jgi:hypothetical protein
MKDEGYRMKDEGKRLKRAEGQKPNVCSIGARQSITAREVRIALTKHVRNVKLIHFIASPFV